MCGVAKHHVRKSQRNQVVHHRHNARPGGRKRELFIKERDEHIDVVAPQLARQPCICPYQFLSRTSVPALDWKALRSNTWGISIEICEVTIRVINGLNPLEHVTGNGADTGARPQCRSPIDSYSKFAWHHN